MFEPDSSELDRFPVFRSSCCCLLCSRFPWFSFLFCYSYYRPWMCPPIPYPQVAGLYSLQVSPHTDIFKLWSLNSKTISLSYLFLARQINLQYLLFHYCFQGKHHLPTSSIITLPSSCQAPNRKISSHTYVRQLHVNKAHLASLHSYFQLLTSIRLTKK